MSIFFFFFFFAINPFNTLIYIPIFINKKKKKKKQQYISYTNFMFEVIGKHQFLAGLAFWYWTIPEKIQTGGDWGGGVKDMEFPGASNK